jgi:hypothetical protein
MSSIKTMGPSPLIRLTAQCLDCRLRHEIPPVLPGAPFLREMDEWAQKHHGHRIEFFSPQRDIPRDLDDRIWDKLGEAPWWLEHAEFKHNANIKLAWAASVAMTFTSVNSLASSAGLVAGASALAVNNNTNLYLDYMLAGFLKNNASSAPTVNTEIDVWVYRAYDDTPTYPDTLAGTDAAKTITTTNILYSGCKQVAGMVVAATTNQVNPFDAGAISGYWNGVTPKLWSVFVVHNSGQALNGSGNTVSYQGSYLASSG